MNQQQKEDSVLFSLRSLMTIEDDRVRQEDEVRHGVAAAALQQVEDARRAEVTAREQAAAVERALREGEAQASRERDEAALRIRLEAESRQHEREMALQMEHEQKLALIAAQHRAGMHPGAVGAGVFAMLAVLVTAGFFGMVQPQQEAIRAETRRAEGARRDSDERRVVAERAADDARRHAAEADAERQRAAAASLQTTQEAARVSALANGLRTVVGASRVRTHHATTRTATGRDEEIIGAIGDELPGGE